MMTNSQTKLTAILQGLETDITEITRQIDSTAQQTSQKIRELQVRAEGDQELARSRYGRALDQINVRHSQDLSLAENQWRRDAQWISNVEQKLEQLCAGTVDARSERQAAQLTTKEIDTLKQEILEIIADLESLHAVRSQA